MTPIKFGTDGWRAIIAQEYTVDNLMRVAEGTARWLLDTGQNSVVIGHDCRFGGPLFANTTARVMARHGIKSYMAPDFVSTPMVSLGVVQLGAGAGVVITASHNPASYNGFKLKSALGGPLSPRYIKEVEAATPSQPPSDVPTLEEARKKGLIEVVDLEQLYLDHIHKHFDLDAIRDADIRFAYDAMYGAGQRAMKRLFPQATLLHCKMNPGFNGQAPEPIDRNLKKLSRVVADDPGLALGIANDGDADRIGMYDRHGQFVDSHHILLLLLLYLHEYKEQTGKVVITFSVTDKMKELAQKFGLSVEVTKIGFKYIADIMAEEDVLVGGEESGGLAVKGHIPERDGIWIGLTILEFMARTGKSLEDLIEEVYQHVGSFAFDRDDLHIAEEKKWAIIERAKSDPFPQLGSYTVERVEDLDGYKFHLGEDRWVLIRPSGTEPVLRVYAQGKDAAEVRQLLDAAHQTLGQV